MEIEFDNKSEFEMAKFSGNPEVRRKFFLNFSNNNQDNTNILVRLCEIR